MKNTSKKVIRMSGAAAAAMTAAAFTAYAATRHLVKLALDREEPKTLKRAGKLISGSRPDSEFLGEIRRSAERLAERENETVKIICHDGAVLAGHWFPCENAKRVVIAMHGWRSTWYTDFGMIADFLEKNDCSVLYAEQRGQNNSGGDYMGFGLIERYDCLDWINWVTDRCGDKLPVYLSGVSMGATTVLMTAGLDLPDNVHGIVADCGFTSPDAIWKHVFHNNLHLPYGVCGAIANNLCRKKIHFRAEEYSTVDALQETSVPILLIHGTDDHFVPVEMTYENYKACNAPKKLFIVPGADHSMSYYVDKNGYEAAVKEFWGQFDES